MFGIVDWYMYSSVPLYLVECVQFSFLALIQEVSTTLLDLTNAHVTRCAFLIGPGPGNQPAKPVTVCYLQKYPKYKAKTLRLEIPSFHNILVCTYTYLVHVMVRSCTQVYVQHEIQQFTS